MKLLVPRSLVCGLLFCAAASAQVQGPNLSIANFSVWSTLPGADGQRRMAISFRVANSGVVAAGATTTQVTVAGNTTSYSTPALAPQAAVFFTQALETTAAQVAIKIETNASQQLANAPELKLQNPGLGITGLAGNGPSNVMQYTANPAGDYGRWEAIGPSRIATSMGESGRVSTIAVSSTDPNTVYAGGRDEGLWKTTGATTTWFPIADALPTLEIDAVALDPGNPNRVMVVTPAGVFQSLNGGSMWQQLTSQNLQANGSDGGKLIIAHAPQLVNKTVETAQTGIVSPINGQRPEQGIYVSTANGLQVSINGGTTWNAVVAGGSPVISCSSAAPMRRNCSPRRPIRPLPMRLKEADSVPHRGTSSRAAHRRRCPAFQRTRACGSPSRKARSGSASAARARIRRASGCGAVPAPLAT
jgi:hypothetical protein